MPVGTPERGEAEMSKQSWSEPLVSQPPAEDAAVPEAKREGRSFLSELPGLLIIAFILALLLKTFAVQAFFIPSESMLPGLAHGDRVLVNKIVFNLREPRRGEVVVFTTGSEAPLSDRGVVQSVVAWLGSGLGVAGSETHYIKRIIGLPGETIEVRDGTVYIDGGALPEQATREGGYLSQPGGPDYGPTVIPEGHFFMMGDNRPHSSDSRSSLGFIADDNVVGRAFVLIWPLGRFSPMSDPRYPV